ncbi:MAG: TetR/AcrR family transcriptional regulator [Alphaproteobacteria bacterium]|nr:TetR/AcrR family transcriptional regulator [Alphaproteobacteria bacterium]
MSVERRRISRGRILQGAIEILDLGVYGDLTVDALARSLRMSKSTLYKYFTSKDDVIVALVDAACADTEEELAAVDRTSGRTTEVLEQLVEVLARYADRIPRAVVLQQARLPTACQDRLQLTRAAVGQALADVLHRGVERHELAWSDPGLAAVTFLAGADAAMKASARGELSLDRGAAVRRLLALYRLGLVEGQRSAA